MAMGEGLSMLEQLKQNWSRAEGVLSKSRPKGRTLPDTASVRTADRNAYHAMGVYLFAKYGSNWKARLLGGVGDPDA